MPTRSKLQQLELNGASMVDIQGDSSKREPYSNSNQCPAIQVSVGYDESPPLSPKISRGGTSASTPIIQSGPSYSFVSSDQRARRASQIARVEDEADRDSMDGDDAQFDGSRHRKHGRLDEKQRKALMAFESIDYWEPNSRIFKEWRRETPASRVDWLRWLLTVVVGCGIACWAFIVFQTTGRLTAEFNYLLFKAIRDDGLGAGYGVMLAWSIGFAVASTLVCTAVPTAAGSGVPDVMAYLNGVLFPGMFNIRTLLAKTLSVICAVVSGLPVGSEGPMIHIGAMLGAGIHTGRSRVLPCFSCDSSSIFAQLRNSKDQRDFITMGAAAGVTAAFSAPVGGMLFVMEEVASYFPISLAWRVFVATLTSSLTLHVLNSYIDGWLLRDRGPFVTGSGDLVQDIVTLFHSSLVDVVPMSMYSVPPAVLLGFLLGIVGVCFTKANVHLTRLRRKVRDSHWKGNTEVLFVILLWSTIRYWMPTGWGCNQIDIARHGPINQTLVALTKFQCTGPFEFNQMATLTLSSWHELLIFLFSNNTYTLMGYGPLITYFAVYVVFACVCATSLWLASGLVIPSFVIGSLGGRIMGLILVDIFGYHGWNDPGVFAVCGAGAFFAGISGLTFSLTVVMMEVSGSMRHVVLIGITIWTSRVVVAQICAHSIFHDNLNQRGVPFIHNHGKDTFDEVSAKEIMKTGVRTLKSVMQVGDLLDMLAASPHNGFPIESVRDGTFRGIIKRGLLVSILHFMQQQYQNGELLRHATVQDLQSIEEKLWDQRTPPCLPELPSDLCELSVDLTPYIDTSAFSVPEAMTVARVRMLYQALGVRHLMVTDRRNVVVGVITRKDLLFHIMRERVREYREKRRAAAIEAAEAMQCNGEGGLNSTQRSQDAADGVLTPMSCHGHYDIGDNFSPTNTPTNQGLGQSFSSTTLLVSSATHRRLSNTASSSQK